MAASADTRRLKRGIKCYLYLYQSRGKKWFGTGTGNGYNNMSGESQGFQAVI